MKSKLRGPEKWSRLVNCPHLDKGSSVLVSAVEQCSVACKEFSFLIAKKKQKKKNMVKVGAKHVLQTSTPH